MLVAKLAFTTAPVTGTASQTANAGPITIQEQDAVQQPDLHAGDSQPQLVLGVRRLLPDAGWHSRDLGDDPGWDRLDGHLLLRRHPCGLPDAHRERLPAERQHCQRSTTGNHQRRAAASFVLSTPSPTAGVAFNETITAFDSFGNTATGFTGTQCITFSGPGASPKGNDPAYPNRGTCTTGIVRRELHERCRHNFDHALQGRGHHADSHFDRNTAVTGSSAFTVASGALGALSLTNPGTQTAGVAFNVTMTATDAYGNTVSGTVSPTFSGPANSPNGTAPSYPASVTFTNGTATASVTLYDAQSATLKVASGGVNATTTFTVSGRSVRGLHLVYPDTDSRHGLHRDHHGRRRLRQRGHRLHGSPVHQLQRAGQFSQRQCPHLPGGGWQLHLRIGSDLQCQRRRHGHHHPVQGGQHDADRHLGQPTHDLGLGDLHRRLRRGTRLLDPDPAGHADGGHGVHDDGRCHRYLRQPLRRNSDRRERPVLHRPVPIRPRPSNKAPSYPTTLTFTNGAATASITLYDAQSTTLTVAATGVTAGHRSHHGERRDGFEVHSVDPVGPRRGTTVHRDDHGARRLRQHGGGLHRHRVRGFSAVRPTRRTTPPRPTRPPVAAPRDPR